MPVTHREMNIIPLVLNAKNIFFQNALANKIECLFFRITNGCHRYL